MEACLFAGIHFVTLYPSVWFKYFIQYMNIRFYK
jgi:hypothetical protein